MWIGFTAKRLYRIAQAFRPGNASRRSSPCLSAVVSGRHGTKEERGDRIGTERLAENSSVISGSLIPKFLGCPKTHPCVSATLSGRIVANLNPGLKAWAIIGNPPGRVEFTDFGAGRSQRAADLCRSPNHSAPSNFANPIWCPLTQDH
jgi:hypothetical protein